MKKFVIVIMLASLALLMLSCSGEDKLAKDTTPPFPPTLTPHLGDTGDLPVTYNGVTFALNEENNGIDAVPDGDWLRIMWHPFLDNDLSHLRIYRFDEFNPQPVLIDSVSASARQFVDSRSTLNYNTVYSYYIDLVDSSGNYSTSDTVSYALLSKSQLISPVNNAYVNPTNIVFTWNRSGFATKYRALVFDSNYEYIWHQDLVVSFEEDPLTIRFPVNLAEQHSGESLIWRIDSFDWNNTLDAFIGSESNEWIIHIQ